MCINKNCHSKSESINHAFRISFRYKIFLIYKGYFVVEKLVLLLELKLLGIHRIFCLYRTLIVCRVFLIRFGLADESKWFFQGKNI